MIDNKLYTQDVEYVSKADLPWEKLSGKKILITGASGLIGTFLIDVLMYRNRNNNMNCHVYAVGRNADRASQIFERYWKSDIFDFISHDINVPLEAETGIVDYVLHMASNTHPVLYSTDPIGTITTNIIGTQNMLDFAVRHQAARFAFASSNEIYGENRGDKEFFDEQYCGYIDSNTMRAGYPESKRCGEALCQAYKNQMGLDVVIPRFTRSYGPTMQLTDTKAISQFILKTINDEDIVLKSVGTQYYSYTYVADAVSGLLTVLLKGGSGEAYNIADEKSDIMLKDLAAILVGITGRKVVFELPDDVEKAGYSTATKARLDGSKLKELGWTAKYSIESGMKRNLEILKSVYRDKHK